MTEGPQGRDGTASVAALAVQVSSLRRDLAALVTRVDVLAAGQQEHAVLLDGIAALRGEVEQITALLAPDQHAAPGRWFWLTMNDEQRAGHLAELTDWVETVLRAQYPAYLAGHVQPCWAQHSEAIWELTWLYQLWTRAYLARKPDPRAAADWHDRWAPGALHRLSGVMRRCEDARHSQGSLDSSEESNGSASGSR